MTAAGRFPLLRRPSEQAIRPVLSVHTLRCAPILALVIERFKIPGISSHRTPTKFSFSTLSDICYIRRLKVKLSLDLFKHPPPPMEDWRYTLFKNGGILYSFSASSQEGSELSPEVPECRNTGICWPWSNHQVSFWSAELFGFRQTYFRVHNPFNKTKAVFVCMYNAGMM
jgi:hypothetical protein